MVELLKDIESIDGGAEKLGVFLTKHYPHMLIDEKVVKQTAEFKPVGVVFPDFNPNLITYPHRKIVGGPNALAEAERFVVDKLKSDYVIHDGIVYIEYLEHSDGGLAEKIPHKNWLIKVWRSKQQSTTA